MKSNDNIPWNETIKKEARGIDDANFGEIQSVDPEYIITQKGIINQEIFYFPKNLIQEYDGNRVIFEVTEEEARNSYMKSQKIDLEQDYHSNSKIENETTIPDSIATNDKSLSNIKEEEEEKEKEVIPLMSEELDVNKRVVEDETVITKKPIKETKTIEVQLNREEIESIERRPPSDESEGEAQNPIQTPQEIKIPLRREEAEVTKKPYVKEVAIKKKAVTDKKEITEDVISEELVHQDN